MGHKSGNILGYDVVSSTYTMCSRGHSPQDPDCRRNHEGSAKSMEPASAVNLVCNNNNLKECNVTIDVVVGDEDAATISHAQRASAHKVEKWTDKNHTVKKFSNKLYTAAKKLKFLSSNVIKYLKK